jgi:uncharacterized lipoprotein YmbA
LSKKTIGFTIATVALSVSLSGCAGAVSNSADVNITLNTQPFFSSFTEDGQPCQSVEKYSLTNPLKDSQVTLKTAEGLASMFAAFIKQEFTRNIFTKLAALVAMLILAVEILLI